MATEQSSIEVPPPRMICVTMRIVVMANVNLGAVILRPLVFGTSFLERLP
jgi:hypothetical protein